MAHCIEEFDRGAVAGFVNETDTEVTLAWHRHPAYEILESTSVPEDMAAKIFSVPMVKIPSCRPDGRVIPKSFHIVRTDHDVIVAPHVGDQFNLIEGKVLWNTISENFLTNFPDLKIESVGTLKNGQLTYVNLKLSTIYIKGDLSPILNRMMVYNPIAMGSYAINLNNIRVVCMNTLRAAEMRGAAAGQLFKVSHTSSAAQKIVNIMEGMATAELKLKSLEDDLNMLADQSVDTKYIDAYLNALFPVSKSKKVDGEKAKRSETMAKRKSNVIREIFESDQSLAPAQVHSKYALLQATTNMFDHAKTRKTSDMMDVAWDGLCGNRANKKDRALQYLISN